VDGEHDPGAAISPASGTEVASPPVNEPATPAASPDQDAFMRLLTGSATLPPLVGGPVRTRSRRGLALVIAAVVLVVLAAAAVAVAASGSGTPAAAPSWTSLFDQPDSPSPVSSPSSEPPAPVWTPNHTGDLARFLVPMPAGAKPTKTPPANEVLDVTKASAFGADAERWKDMLYTWEFSRGVVRRWSVNAEMYEVVLFQFYNPANAEGFIAANRQGLETSPNWRSVTAAHYGSVFVSTTTTGGFVSQLAVAQTDDIMVLIEAATKPSTSTSITENLLYTEIHLL
jgi:hypothetical protein